MNKNYFKIITFLIALFLTLTILLSTFNSKVYDEDFYMDLYEKNNVVFNESVKINKTGEVIGFFKGESELDKEFFTVDEISHMNDVRNILHGLKYLYLFSLFSTLFGIAYFVYKKKSIKPVFIQSFIISIALIIIFLLPFDFVFESMHKLLFPSGNYSFYNTSNLVQLFPAGFFAGFLQSVIISFLLKEVLILGLSFVVKEDSKKKKSKN